MYDAYGNQIQLGTWDAPATFTVGPDGDFPTLQQALVHASSAYPAYRPGGMRITIKLLSGFVLSEQVSVVGADFGYIRIISEDGEVPVDGSAFTRQSLDAHDLRGNDGALIGGENGAGLPTVGCVFRLISSNNKKVCGLFANRSSHGVVLANSGFVGFHDGVISNNESSVTIREGIAKSSVRWGVHARHNGEVSARSAILTDCGECAAYADRVADLDVREADLSGSAQAILAANGSTVCAAGAHYLRGGKGTLVQASSGSVIAAGGMEIRDPSCKTVFGTMYGGFLDAHSIAFSNANSATVFSKKANALNSHGIIFADSSLA